LPNPSLIPEPAKPAHLIWISELGVLDSNEESILSIEDTSQMLPSARIKIEPSSDLSARYVSSAAYKES
jgi:hypothetical protein